MTERVERRDDQSGGAKSRGPLSRRQRELRAWERKLGGALENNAVQGRGRGGRG